MDHWITEVGDQPNLPEKQLLHQLWNGSETQPVTANPNIKKQGNEVGINCCTEGASIGYKIVNDKNTLVNWLVYDGPFKVKKAPQILFKAHRISFQPSETVGIDF